jgi:hypothetical protein
MLQLRQALLLLLLFPLLNACKEPLKAKDGTVFKTPADYNDYIISRQTKIIRNIIELGNKAGISADTAYGLLNKFSAQTDSVIGEIKGMPPYRADSSFRNAAIHSFDFYKRLFDKHYREILSIRLKGGDATEEGVNEIMDITGKIKREEEELDKQLHSAQTAFAEKYNMKMKPNAIQKEIDKKD